MAILSKAAVAAGAGLAAALIGNGIDHKYNISSDIAQIRAARQQRRHAANLQSKFGEDDWSFYHVLHGTYGLNEYDEAFLFEDRSWTYAEFRAEVGRLALAFEAMGIKNRTVVGMYINNSPEFYFAWWALFKLGAVPAPLNTAISQQPFRHCLKISEAEYFLCSYELWDVASSSLSLEAMGATGATFNDPRIPCLRSISIYDYNTYPRSVSLDVLPVGVNVIAHDSLSPVHRDMASWPREKRPKIRSEETSQYLFTSGTTGLPKAATWPAGYSHMSASRYRWPRLFEQRRRLYACTPLFHGGATYALLPATVASGGTVCLSRKFSVRTFWHDIRRTRSNIIFYIGEMIRFLSQAPLDPVHPDESKANCLSVIYGLGITPPIWRAFRNRFNPSLWIGEYYGATEGTTSISYSNFTNDVVSKVAHWGPLMRSSWFGQDVFYIVRIDFETGEVVRDPKTGLCSQAGWDEVGEAVNRVRPPLQRTHDYVGEGGSEATEKKILRDVFQKGDLFWRLGDALSMDRNGYVQFHDRLGDTFRAKGHNISTAEVEMAFLDHPHIASANVYAIAMSQYGYEGQVGCAAITLKEGAAPDQAGPAEEMALSGLETYLTNQAGLAIYAVPRFIRVLVDIDEEEAAQREQIGISDTVGSEYVSLMMKKLKAGLRKEAFAPPKGCKDRMYWIEREGRGFSHLDTGIQQQLLTGRAQF